MKYVIGLDLGSTAVKGVAIDETGEIMSVERETIDFGQATRQSVYELPPDDYVRLVCSLLGKLVDKRHVLASMAWVTASGNLILLDKQGRALAPMMSWLDTRPLDGSIDQELAAIPASKVYRTVGWPLAPQFPLGRLLWIRKNHPELLHHAHRICMNNDYLGHYLTGIWALDYSTATTFYLYDQQKRTISSEQLALAGVSSEQISPLLPSGARLGPLKAEICRRYDLDRGAAPHVVLGCFDHPGAARAIGLRTLSQLMFSCGTSWVGCMLLPDRETGLQRRLLIDPFTSSSGGNWFGMFSEAGLGRQFDNWVSELLARFGLGSSLDFGLFDQLASRADGNRVPIVDPAQQRLDDALYAQLDGAYSRQAIARAVLEGVVFSFKLLMQTKGLSIDSVDEIFLVGGPTESSLWPQIIADSFERPVFMRFGQTAGAVGAALMAAEGIGMPLELQGGTKTVVPDPARFDQLRHRFTRFCKLRQT
ncbi:MAG: hypothetical protein EA384_01010 [Spirochaetaceae bacterium]|nr:MAG: hypothetical protein EA384_01010 [Spirochaetaceae bacterium]